MTIINDKNFQMQSNTVVTFGKFDGIHKGHRKLFKTAREIADKENLPLVAFTFKVCEGCKFGYMENSRITTDKERNEIFESLGADYVVEFPFDEEVAATEAMDFIRNVISNMLKASYVVVGTDWTFGKNKAGNTDVLKASQKLFNFTAVVMEKELYQQREIGSSWIREEIINGNMENAAILLDYPYTISGNVCHGKKIGSTMGIPTVNIVPEEEKILPPYGVYASKVYIGNELYYGVTNIGVRPSVPEQNGLAIETFILDFDKDIYEEDIKVCLCHFQRPEMKFSDMQALAKQIEQDIQFTKSYFMI